MNKVVEKKNNNNIKSHDLFTMHLKGDVHPPFPWWLRFSNNSEL